MTPPAESALPESSRALEVEKVTSEEALVSLMSGQRPLWRECSTEPLFSLMLCATKVQNGCLAYRAVTDNRRLELVG